MDVGVVTSKRLGNKNFTLFASVLSLCAIWDALVGRKLNTFCKEHSVRYDHETKFVIVWVNFLLLLSYFCLFKALAICSLEDFNTADIVQSACSILHRSFANLLTSPRLKHAFVKDELITAIKEHYMHLAATLVCGHSPQQNAPKVILNVKDKIWHHH